MWMSIADVILHEYARHQRANVVLSPSSDAAKVASQLTRQVNGGSQGLGQVGWGAAVQWDGVSVREGEEVLDVGGGDGRTTV